MESQSRLVCLVDALTDNERARQRELVALLARAVGEVREISNGFDFDLGFDQGTFQMAAEWIAMERRCCPFLTFTLEWSGDTPIMLRLTGPPAAKAFIAETFNTFTQPAEP
jgi:hypothetical protein